MSYAKMNRIVLAGIVAAGTAVAGPAGPSEQAPGTDLAGLVQQECGNEQLALAEGACVGALADALILEMDARIAGLTVGLQGASASELSAFEIGLLRGQSRWRSGMESKCETRSMSRAAMPAARQICRLNEGLKRERALEQSLSGEFAALAGTTGAMPYGAVEITLPLADRFPGGPAGEVELRIPLSPD